jgi:hypothetical protein
MRLDDAYNTEVSRCMPRSSVCTGGTLRRGVCRRDAARQLSLTRCSVFDTPIPVTSSSARWRDEQPGADAGAFSIGADIPAIIADGPENGYGASSMPTVLRSGPYRVYFYSHEPNEPPHVHVDRDDRTAKFWLAPVELARNLGFSARELTQIEALIQLHRQALSEAWNEHFGS